MPSSPYSRIGAAEPSPSRAELLVHLLLGLASWLGMNGVFAELPLLANALPEGA